MDGTEDMDSDVAGDAAMSVQQGSDVGAEAERHRLLLLTDSQLVVYEITA